MTLIDLLILQFLAHLLADFTFQRKDWADDKIDNGFKSKHLYWHIMIVFVFSWLLSFQWSFIYASLAITLFHFLLDAIKKSLINLQIIQKYVFIIDQSLHLLVIIACVFLFNRFFIINPVINYSIKTHYLLIITAYILCTKPANIIIKEIFKMYGISIVNEEGIMNAGNLIGIVERMITLTLILYGQFAAVGFIITGKSILRFRDTNMSKTEYVLIGTLLSFGIAILTGIGIHIIK